MRQYSSNEKPAKQLDQRQRDLIARIQRDFKVASETYSEQRELAREDFRFRSGDQWPDSVKKEREIARRPCLTVNKLPQFIKQVVNNQKINRPSINVNPNDSQASIEVAKVIQAIIKNVETRSMAENAYDTAFDCAVTCGEGYFRIVSDYADEMSFDQELNIVPIDNVFSVYIDPNFKSDFTDIEWGFIFDDMPRREFERRFPESECATGHMFADAGDTWIRDDMIRVAEYFYIDYEPEKIVQLDTGEILFKSEFEKLKGKGGARIVKERDSHKRTVKWVKTNGHEILEESKVSGQYIPIVPVFADTYIGASGQRVFEGIVRQAKDPQRAYNFWYSAETEMIALAPKATYIGAAGQFEGFERQWASANVSNLPYLEYKPLSLASGQPMPAPQRTQFDPQIQSIILAKQGANEDLKATTGIYDPSLGKEQKEASGRALITKQRQAEVTNFMYIDNLCKSLKYAGKVMLSQIPEVYDSERVIRVRGGVNEPDELLTINTFDEKSPVFLEVGKYDVDVSIGPYGENQRQEALDSMMALMQIKPELVEVIGDLFVAKQDWQGAKQMAERMKLMLPPQLQEINTELPPEVQAQIAQKDVQMQQMQQLIADLTAEANRANAAESNKQAELESRERIAAMDNRTKLLIEQMKQQSADGRLAFEQELAILNARAQGAPEVPVQGDELVLSGVNDPVTQATQEEQGVELTPEEEADLMAKLQNFTPETTRM